MIRKAETRLMPSAGRFSAGRFSAGLFSAGLFSAAVLGMCLSFTVAAAEETEKKTSPVDGALDDSVWYDAELEKLVPVQVEPTTDDSLNRQSRWLPKAQRVKQSTTPTTTAAGGGTGVFGSGLTIRNLLGWLLLITLIAAAVAALAYAISKAEVDIGANSQSISSKLSNLPDEQTIERMKHLPEELRRTDINLRSEAQRLMNEGRCDQAIILLFGHQLLLLDRVGMLRLNRGKTNRKYVRETRTADTASAVRLQATVMAFERSYFGRHEITRSEFADLWRANGELEQAADRRQEVAA